MNVVTSVFSFSRISFTRLPAVLALVCAGTLNGHAQQPPQPKAPAKIEAPKKVEPSKLDAAPPSIEKINSYFNTMKGLQADFVQYAPDGRSFNGVLYLLRPGRMRFEYHPPAALEIVSDGVGVAIRDRKLKTQDEYFVGQTPLKFLLQPKIDVTKDSKVTDLKRTGADIQLFLEDKSTIGGTSRIKVVFDGQSYGLKEWTVTDPQGYDTRVVLSNINPAATPDKNLFVIERQKILNPN